MEGVLFLEKRHTLVFRYYYRESNLKKFIIILTLPIPTGSRQPIPMIAAAG